MPSLAPRIPRPSRCNSRFSKIRRTDVAETPLPRFLPSSYGCPWRGPRIYHLDRPPIGFVWVKATKMFEPTDWALAIETDATTYGRAEGPTSFYLSRTAFGEDRQDALGQSLH